jgi:transposase
MSNLIIPDIGSESQSIESIEKKAAQTRIGLLELAEALGNVSKACKMVGYSRDSFYRFKKRYARGGEAALEDVSRRKPILKNRVSPAVESAVLELALRRPLWGQARVAAELTKRGLRVSAAGVRCVWVRHGLHTSELRLRAVESGSAPERAEFSQVECQ